jgi:hypothetical protein
MHDARDWQEFPVWLVAPARLSATTSKQAERKQGHEILQARIEGTQKDIEHDLGSASIMTTRLDVQACVEPRGNRAI